MPIAAPRCAPLSPFAPPGARFAIALSFSILVLSLSLSTVVARTAHAEPPSLDARQTRILGDVCARCHVRPGIGVPQLGDASEWETRGAVGLGELMRRTVEGYGAMPALGTCSYCSEDDLRSLVAYMAQMPLPETEPAARPEMPAPAPEAPGP